MEVFDGATPAALTAIVSGLAWLVKYALIYANGGPTQPAGTGTEAFWIPAFYLLGAGTLILAGALAAWALTRKLPKWVRALAVPIGGVLAFAFHTWMDPVGDAMYPMQGWQQEESGIWITAVVALVAGLVTLAVNGWVRFEKKTPATARTD